MYHKVLIGEVSSTILPVNSGVRQKFIVGPELFIIFMNDLFVYITPVTVLVSVIILRWVVLLRIFTFHKRKNQYYFTLPIFGLLTQNNLKLNLDKTISFLLYHK